MHQGSFERKKKSCSKHKPILSSSSHAMKSCCMGLSRMIFFQGGRCHITRLREFERSPPHAMFFRRTASDNFVIYRKESSTLVEWGCLSQCVAYLWTHPRAPMLPWAGGHTRTCAAPEPRASRFETSPPCHSEIPGWRYGSRFLRRHTSIS